jgi:integrase
MATGYQREKTKYPGVFIVERSGERYVYIMYRHTVSKKQVEEKLGTVSQGWTAARGNTERAKRIAGIQSSNSERRQQQRAEKEAEANRWTFSRLLEEYLASKPELRSEKAMSYNFNKHSVSFVGDKMPEELTHWDIESIKRKLTKSKAQPKTVFNTLDYLKRLANFGFKRGLCANVPFHIELPTVHNKTTEYLTPEELNRLLLALEEEPEPIRNFFHFMIQTGFRRDELQTLIWSDIDLNRKGILIRAINAKSGRDESVPLSDAAMNVLVAQYQIRDQRQPDIAKRDLVFFTQTGHEWGKSQSAITKIYKRLKEKAELPENFRGNHGIRHTFGSLHANKETAPLVIQKLMQHKDLRTTMRYIELADKSVREGAQRTGELIEDYLQSKSIDLEAPVADLNSEGIQHPA